MLGSPCTEINAPTCSSEFNAGVSYVSEKTRSEYEDYKRRVLIFVPRIEKRQ